jgi:tetratricopeptide (TPR) repeat protein
MRAVATGLSLVAAIAICRPAVGDELDTLAKNVDDHPEDKNAYDEFAKAALKAKRYDDVIKKVKLGTARMEGYTQGYYWLALAYRSKKEWPDAADYYRRYIEKNPGKTDPYFGLAASLEGLGDKKGAIAAYDKYVSLEKAPEKQRFVDLAKAELVKLDPSRAPAAPTPAPTPPPAPAPVARPVTPPPAPAPAPVARPVTPPPAAPPSANAGQLRQQAEQLRKDGKLEDAARAYQQAIDADRGNVELHNELGNVYFSLKRYDDAAASFRNATSRDPNYALGWYNLAHALRKGDKKREAVDAYRQYMRLKPDDPDPYYGLGQTLKALGDVPGAIDAFRKYVNMEKRPDEQKWVDKARTELEQLEAMQKGSTPSGRIEEKGSDDATTSRVRERLREGTPHDVDGLIDPFKQPGELRQDPFDDTRARDLRDPFHPTQDDMLAPSLKTSERQRLREYGAAIEAYRRALSRHAETVSERYQRGVSYALADDAHDAAKLWNSVPLDDDQVKAARKSVEKVRALVASRR